MKLLNLKNYIRHLLLSGLEKEETKKQMFSLKSEAIKIEEYREMLLNLDKIQSSIENSKSHPDCYLYLYNYVNVFAAKYPEQKGLVFHLKKQISKKGKNSKNYFYE